MIRISMIRISACLSLASLLLGCARSAEDRELDRIFAHQAALRDTTGTAVGRVVDSGTNAPLGGVYVFTKMHGDVTDSAGRFVIQYLGNGVHAVNAKRPGYQPTKVEIAISPPDTSTVDIQLARAEMPRYELEGRWGLELILDSAGPQQQPTARRLEGRLMLSREFPSPWGPRDSTGQSDPWVRAIDGQYELDLTPFWGTQVAPDVSTTVFGPASPTFAKEASAATFNGDSISVSFIPRISHGGISLAGRLVHADSAVGKWHQRAYCCGAFGRFRMWRISRDPGTITIPPPVVQSKPDTLPEKHRADIRVRIWDEAHNTYIKGWHDLRFPDGSIQSVYTTGTQPEGWGKAFWLAPGRYSIIVNLYPCGSERFFVRRDIERRFVARAGERQDITIRLNTRTLQPRRSYNNTAGLRCRLALPDSLRSGA